MRAHGGGAHSSERAKGDEVPDLHSTEKCVLPAPMRAWQHAAVVISSRWSCTRACVLFMLLVGGAG